MKPNKQDDFLNDSIATLGFHLLNEQADGLLQNKTFGSYKILRLLGRGGMGRVYLARHVETGQAVALKLLNETATKDADRVRRFRQESHAASLIRHANVAEVYEVGEVENNQFIAMEFVDGMTLRERLKNNDFTLGEALRIAEQIASALTAAHERGVIHRDFKPENVMIGRDGQAKVLDFGLAKLIKPVALQSASKNATAPANLLTDHNSTAFGVIFGTATYMSPEQVRGQKTDERTDIWSFGVLLYEMLAGLPPFRGKTNMDVIAAVLTAEPKPLTESFPDMPLELVSLVQRALQKEPEQREKDCSAIADELNQIIEQLKKSEDGALTLSRPCRLTLTEETDTNRQLTTVRDYDIEKDRSKSKQHTKRLRKSFLTVGVGILVVMAGVSASYLFIKRLKASTTNSTPTNVVRSDTSTSQNSEAEREYQLGIYIWNKRASEEMPKALAHFQKAIELDPAHARAYDGLAKTYLWDGNPNLTWEEQIAHARAAVKRALAIDPNSAEAHTTLAFVLERECNWSEAELKYRKAIELNLNYPTAHQWFAECLTFMGRDDEAIEHINKALELDPLSFAILNDAMTINWYAGRYNEAIAKAEKMIAFDARYEQRARLWLSRLYFDIGNKERTWKEYERFMELSKGKVSDTDNASLYAQIGDREKALSYLKKAEISKDKNSEAFNIAGIYAILDMREEAFKWLDIALNNHQGISLAANPDFDKLRSDPRYMKLLERMNLAEYWRGKF